MTPADIDRWMAVAGTFHGALDTNNFASIAYYAGVAAGRAEALEEAAQTAESYPRADQWIADEIASAIRSLAKEQQK